VKEFALIQSLLLLGNFLSDISFYVVDSI